MEKSVAQARAPYLAMTRDWFVLRRSGSGAGYHSEISMQQALLALMMTTSCWLLAYFTTIDVRGMRITICLSLMRMALAFILAT